MRRHRRSVAALALAGSLALAACGDPDGEPVATDGAATSAGTDAPPTTEPEQPAASEPDTAPEPEPTTAEPAPESDAEAEPEAGAETERELGSEPVAEEPAIAPAQIGGRQLGEMLRAESDVDANPLPDLLVDDVRAGAKVNVRNILPADRPVLLWAWAPH